MREVGEVVAFGEVVAEAHDFGNDAEWAKATGEGDGSEPRGGTAGARARLLREGREGFGKLGGGEAGCAGLSEDGTDGSE